MRLELQNLILDADCKFLWELIVGGRHPECSSRGARTYQESHLDAGVEVLEEWLSRICTSGGPTREEALLALKAADAVRRLKFVVERPERASLNKMVANRDDGYEKMRDRARSLRSRGFNVNRIQGAEPGILIDAERRLKAARDAEIGLKAARDAEIGRKAVAVARRRREARNKQKR